MKRLFVLLAALAALAAIVAGSALAGGGPAPKATGDFWYANPWTGVPTHITFVAQDLGGSAKGSMSYEDSRGSYQARVIEAHVGTTGEATFTAEITSSTGAYAVGASEPRPAGTLVPMKVVDKGEPGVNDQAIYLPGDGHEYPLGPLTAGNIQVHS
jgi:hypothetical protein